MDALLRMVATGIVVAQSGHACMNLPGRCKENCWKVAGRGTGAACGVFREGKPCPTAPVASDARVVRREFVAIATVVGAKTLSDGHF